MPPWWHCWLVWTCLCKFTLFWNMQIALSLTVAYYIVVPILEIFVIMISLFECFQKCVISFTLFWNRFNNHHFYREIPKWGTLKKGQARGRLSSTHELLRQIRQKARVAKNTEIWWWTRTRSVWKSGQATGKADSRQSSVTYAMEPGRRFPGVVWALKLVEENWWQHSNCKKI